MYYQQKAGALRIYIVVVAVSIALMTYQSTSGPLRMFSVVGTLIEWTNSITRGITSGTSTLIRAVSLNESELRSLKEEVQQAETMKQQYVEVMLQNERLRALLEMPASGLRRVAAARVISRGSARWSNIFIIDKGSSQGIRKDMVAITPAGLAGKVRSVTSGTAEVLLVDDSRFSVAVRLQKSRTEAVLTGEGRGKASLKYVPVDVAVESGEQVVTSGLDALFPPGIYAGFVTSVKTDENEIFHEIEAVNAVDTSRVEEVVIVAR